MNKLDSISKSNSFNFLRLVCCFVVLYEHAVYLSGVNLPCLDLREIAVKVFFILSGGWVTLSYLKSPSLKNYFVKRAKKILPQYWLVVVLTAVLLASFSILSVHDYFLNKDFYKYLLANIFALNFIQPTLPGVFEGLALGGSVNGSLWTIKVEVAFYVLLPFIIFLIRKIDKKSGGANV